MLSTLDQARPQILSTISSTSGGVFTESDLKRMLTQYRAEWRVARSITFQKFIAFLVEKLGLRRVELRSEHHGKLTRYTRGEFSPYVMALSLRPRSYLSHGTAVFLHGLNEQLPKTIYVNQEQSEKGQASGLSQEGITRAFSRHQRTSRYVFNVSGYRVVLLSGKNTGRQGVVNVKGPVGEGLPATGVPRTLIDIVVRPAYAGGVFQVAAAFRGAKGRFDVKELVRTLRKLNHAYPYHQAIGFLMERAGYSTAECDQLKRIGTKFDFYLAHAMKNSSWDPQWRLFFPEGL